jgi:hypothetical protein
MCRRELVDRGRADCLLKHEAAAGGGDAVLRAWASFNVSNRVCRPPDKATRLHLDFVQLANCNHASTG